MQFVNQLISQIRQLLESMTPGSRMIAVLLLICIVVSSSFLVRGTSSQANAYLYGGRDFSSSELDAMESAFGSSGLHTYERIGRRMSVPASERSAYMKALADNHALPRNLSGSTEDAFDGNILEPMDVQHQRAQLNKEQNIANAIRTFPFVEDAYLTTSEQKKGFGREKKMTAAVFVAPRMGKVLSDDQKRNIMKLVEKSFAGLKYEDIVIADMSNASSLAGDLDPMTAEDQKYFIAKEQQEAQLKAKALNLLRDYGDVRVEVNMELDTTLREASEILKYSDKTTTLSTSEIKKEVESAKPSAGGRPGANPNATSINTSKNLDQFAQESSKQKESSVTEQKRPGTEVVVTDKAGLTPKTASIVVALPQTYYKKAFFRQWLDQNPDKTQTDLASIDKTLLLQGVTNIKAEVDKNVQRQLAALLPPEPPGGDRFPRIVVNDYPDSPAIEPPEPKLTDTLLRYAIENWQVVGLFFLSIAALLFLRSVSRSSPAGSADEGFDNGFSLQLEDPATWDLSALGEGAEAMAASVGGGGGESADGQRGRRFNTTGGEIKEELTTLVRDNPDAAASLLRTWIGDPA